ncbi:unnamed protein product [Brassicogethes aeneus]|uniref:MADF domain-containing protein n=1 Tax=Brassicogethes aeneus TaxID=1431903 RepID=A0A9P0ASC5_BRAAE|nr:unnamed protein product [Brassicogethes aeneus]
MPNCNLCDKTFARSSSLKLHVKNKHPNDFENMYKVIEKGIMCRFCQKGFVRQYTLKVHIKRFHSEFFNEVYPEVAYKFNCPHCNNHFNHLRSYKYHLKTHEPNTLSRQKMLKCALCKIFFSNNMIKNHFKMVHDVTIEFDEINFSSVAEFNEWKNHVEVEFSTQYRKQYTKSSKHHVLTSYICSRSGMYAPRGQGKRHIKLQGTKKINAYCPSSISLKINTEGFCNVKFVKTHVGHKSELAHMTLTKKEKEEIRDQMWQEIYREFGENAGFSVEFLSKKWRTLRDTYVRIKGEYTPSGAAASKKRKWEYFEYMTFLNDTIKYQATLSNVILSPNTLGTESPSITSSPITSPNDLPNQQGRKGKNLKDKERKNVEHAILDALNKVNAPIEVTNPSPHSKINPICDRISQLLEQMPQGPRTRLEIKLLQVAYENSKDYLS